MRDDLRPRRSWPATIVGVLVAALSVGLALLVTAAGQGAGSWGDALLVRLGLREPDPGSHAFMAVTPRGDPIGYDPCVAIDVEVHTALAPEGWRELLEDSFAHVQEASGLQLRVVGETDRTSVPRDTSRPSPVLVRWALPEDEPRLEGRVAGFAGSRIGPSETGLSARYTTGLVVLDAEVFEDEMSHGERPFALAIVDHEMGHLVGLDHVDDAGELMNADNLGRTSYGPGDRVGLRELGDLPCAP